MVQNVDTFTILNAHRCRFVSYQDIESNLPAYLKADLLKTKLEKVQQDIEDQLNQLKD